MIKLYEENKKEEEKDVYLRLGYNKDHVILYTCDVEGRHIFGGNLIRFHQNRRVEMCGAISSDLGFKLDSHGYLEISKS